MKVVEMNVCMMMLFNFVVGIVVDFGYVLLGEVGFWEMILEKLVVVGILILIL